MTMQDQESNLSTNNQDQPSKKWRWILLTLLIVIVTFGTPVGIRFWNYYDITHIRPRTEFQQHVDIKLTRLDVSQVPFKAEFKITNRSKVEGARVELLSLDALASWGKYVDSKGAKWQFKTKLGSVIYDSFGNPLDQPFTPMIKPGETRTITMQLMVNRYSFEPVGHNLFASPEPKQLNYLLQDIVEINLENMPSTLTEPVISQGVVKIDW